MRVPQNFLMKLFGQIPRSKEPSSCSLSLDKELVYSGKWTRVIPFPV